MDHKRAGEEFTALLDIMAQLRGTDGCPWDKEQSHVSLRSFLLEECHELLEVLQDGNPAKIREELGDVLHQIVFHCQIAEESGAFSAEDVVRDLRDKMVRRHPHVFSGDPLPNSETVLKRWAETKANENDSNPKSVLGDLPKSMPALARAQTITDRASQVGFDWSSVAPVWSKVEEELAELKTACATDETQRTIEELGDVIFSLVNLSRFLGIRAEDALAQATQRFIKRFHHIESRLREAGTTPAASSLEVMDRLWNEAKALEHGEKAAP